MNSEYLISQLMKSETLHDDMHLLLTEYVKQEKTAHSRLLVWITSIVNTELSKRDMTSNARLRGIEELIHMYISGDHPHEHIPYIIQSVMEYFPRGVSDGASELGKQFFNCFVRGLRQQMDSLIDSYWATQIVPCNDYLKKVLALNPEEGE